ncbi:MAG: hypothetical protein QNJ60_02590 [Xenococcaceae cyanobacterium MO_188.B19]|nr:hypothetical protein [Xenococcaceae cyanobacterium MO_188.B19]
MTGIEEIVIGAVIKGGAGTDFSRYLFKIVLISYNHGLGKTPGKNGRKMDSLCAGERR